jgi:predicted adenylyl cyclase CyaB
MQNVEFKAELRDLELARAIAGKIGAKFVEQLWQTDTYYKLADGRLKKRQTEGRPDEYIFYFRDNHNRPRLSRFKIYSPQEAQERFGKVDLPVWVVVKKVRDVWMYEHVRVHLDQVDAVGTYFELEAMVSPRQHLARCYELVNQLRADFAPVLGEALSKSYSDLLSEEPDLSPPDELIR